MSLIKNSTINLVGNLIPALVSFPAYGYLARVLGVESFGIYTLVILVIGYAGVFDAGLTRAAIREIAINRNNKEEQGKIIACGTITIFAFGCFASLLIKIFSPSIVSLLNISIEKTPEAISSISLLALTLPIFLINQMWLSILEGNEDFIKLNIQRSIGSVIVAGIPVIMIFFEPTLFSATLGLLIARILTLLITACVVKDEVLSAGLKFNFNVFKRMVGFGGWTALTGIISPIMVYFDRFILAGMVGAKYVAFYTAPAEIISKGSIVPGAVGRSIFPKLSLMNNSDERVKIRSLGYKLITSICGLGTVLGLCLSEFVMTTWMGSEFGGEPVLILQILLIGFFFNSVAQVPFADIQAKGHSKITAILHMLEIIPYILILVLLIKLYGATGAAIAWSLRVAVDFLILAYISNKIR